MQSTKKRRRNNREWPRIIKSGSAVVKVYQTKHATNSTGFAYVVSYSTPSGRKQKKYADPQSALNEARLVASKIIAGQVEATDLSKGERDEYVSAKNIIGNYPLIAAIHEWHKARELCGTSIIQAAQAWKDSYGKGVKEILIKDIATSFIKDKKRQGLKTKASYERTFPRFIEEFGDYPINALTKNDLSEWLYKAFTVSGKANIHPETFNSHRKRLKTLFKWARDNGYLPRNAQTEVDLIPKMKVKRGPIGIFKVQEYSSILKLIKKKKPKYLAATVLAGFTGLRSIEIGTQKWEDIDLKRQFLKVSNAKEGTPAKRIVPLCSAAIEWLTMCDKINPLVAPKHNAIDIIRKEIRTANIACPDNGFRHSYISYKVAETSNVDETALFSGNSRDIIFKHYRELVSKADGLEWFSLTPAIVTKTPSVSNFHTATA